MGKTLYLMRHGQTLFNRQHKIQGACDSPLTVKGIADAKKVGNYFKKIKLSLIMFTLQLKSGPLILWN
jgi:Fructose-2,6-bisphosphatase